MPVTFLGMAFIGVSWVWMGYEVFGAQYRWIDSSSVSASHYPVLFFSRSFHLYRGLSRPLRPAITWAHVSAAYSMQRMNKRSRERYEIP